MRILIAEDNTLMGLGLQAALVSSGFDVVWAKDGEGALECIANQPFHALVLDLGLPGISGMDVLRSLRSEGNHLPVLILTARETTEDKVQAFTQGADDFVSKTTDIEELVARLKALIRRSGRDGKFILEDLVLDVDSRTVIHKGEALSLSKREFDILKVLISHAGLTVSRKQIEEAIYGEARQKDNNSIEVHISNLRHKIVGLNLLSVRGVGYCLARSP
jgi:two-component system OmpR family response regulator/two-component system response regulator QseB